MKKIGLFFLTALGALFILSACNDSDGDYPNSKAFVTVKTLENNDYYFLLDDAKTLYPGDTKRIGAYKATDGQRALVYFNFLDHKIEGYDYNAALYEVKDILTKDIKIVTTAEELIEVGDDPLSLDGSRIAGGFLTLEFGLQTYNGATHEMNLVVNQTDKPGENLEGYTTVEFHQKASRSQAEWSSYSRYNLVAFRLGDLAPAVTGSKGFYIRYRNMYGNIEYHKIDLPQEK